MPTKVRRRIFPIGGGPPLTAEHQLEHVEITLDARGEVLRRLYVLEDGKRFEARDLIFTESDKDELAAMETEARLLAEKKEFVMTKDGRPRYLNPLPNRRRRSSY